MPQPAVDAERCVHALSPVARCRACVDACPRAAFALGDGGLALDTALCDGCGLCAAACPQQAIALASSDDSGLAAPRAPAPFVAPGPAARHAFAACDRVAGGGEAGWMPCLDAIGLVALARLYAGGVRVLTVAHGDCDNCPRRTDRTLAGHLAALTGLTDERGLERLTLRHDGVAAWRQARDEAGRMTRRGLFRRVLGAAEAVGTATGRADKPRAPGSILDGRDKARRALFAPLIDSGACTACGVCVRVCPHGAIALVGQAEASPRYSFDALECTGCGLCVDACDKGAMRLEHDVSLPRPPLNLVAGQCAACGNPYLSVEGRHHAQASRCPVCAAKSTRQMLFQVLP